MVAQHVAEKLIVLHHALDGDGVKRPSEAEEEVINGIGIRFLDHLCILLKVPHHLREHLFHLGEGCAKRSMFFCTIVSPGMPVSQSTRHQPPGSPDASCACREQAQARTLHVPETGVNQHECRVTVGEGTYHPRISRFNR